MAEAAIGLKDIAAGRRVRPLTGEYAGLNLVGGHFVAVFGSADRYLGQLDSLLETGSPDDRFRAALGLDVRTRAPLHRAETLAAHAAYLRRTAKDTARAHDFTKQNPRIRALEDVAGSMILAAPSMPGTPATAPPASPGHHPAERPRTSTRAPRDPIAGHVPLKPGEPDGHEPHGW
jgi:hypothetical protein